MVMWSGCFSPPEVYEWAVVEVRNDEVVAARLLNGTDVEFEFDSELGYPLKMVLNAKDGIAGGGVAYDARGLVRVMIATN